MGNSFFINYLIVVFVIFVMFVIFVTVLLYSKSKYNSVQLKKSDIDFYKKLILDNEQLKKYKKSGLFSKLFASKQYSQIYKQEIVTKVLANYNSRLNYFPNDGIKKDDYIFADFEKFNRFESEDLINGKIVGMDFSLSNVHTYRLDRDKDGNTTYRTLFMGVVACVHLKKNINAFIYIINNNLKILNNEYYLNIDNEAFEKKYDVFSDNHVLAMRMLTPSVTNSILDLEDKTGIYTEIKIYNDVVYFRFYTGNLFKPNIFNTDLEAKNLALSIELLKGIEIIIQNILETIVEVD